MKKFVTAIAACAVVACAVSTGATNSVQAMPVASATQAQTVDAPSQVIKVGRRGFGAGVAVGVGAAIIGGAIIAEERRRSRRRHYRVRRRYESPADRCARRYRSFSYATGTFVGYDGYERRCPYL